MQGIHMVPPQFSEARVFYPHQDLAVAARKYSRQRSLLAFIIPVVVMFFAFGLQGVFPFGKQHILTVDLYHQYAPFLSDFRQKLLEGDSWFFSWSGGLGVNFYALYAYYLASPLNFLILIFPDHLLSEFVLLLVLVKIGLAGASFHFFLREYYHRDGPLALGLAVAYALSGYNMAYFFNIMWLDTLYCLPLLAWGMAKLIRHKVYTPYILLLALTLISNFYTGFFACLFLFFFFFVLVSRENLPTWTDRFLVLLRVSLASLVGLALSAITLYPTLRAMGLTSAVGDGFPKDYSMNFAGIDFLSRLLPFSSVSVRSGMANLFSGSFVLLLLLALAKSRSLAARTKALSFGLLFFLFASLNNNVLNFIWHGLHFPNQLPYRNAFVLIFYILFLSYDALPRLRELSHDFMMQAVGLYGLVYLLLLKLDRVSYEQLSVYVGLVLLVLYASLFSRYTRRPQSAGTSRFASPSRRRRQRQAVSYLLLALMLSELTVNSFVSIDKFEAAEYFGPREGYSNGEEVAQLRSAIAQLKAKNSQQLTRMEIKPDKCVNDAMLYRSNGLTIFSSTVPQSPVSYFSQLGYPNNGINSYQYMGGNPVLDSLLALRYVIHRDDQQVVDGLYEPVLTEGPIQVWENTQALPVAFLADGSHVPLAYQLGQAKPETAIAQTGLASAFDYHEKMLADLSGLPDLDLFEPLLFEEDSHTFEGLTASYQYGKVSINRNGLYNASYKQPFTVEEDGYYYLAWKLSSLSIREINLRETEDLLKRVGRKSQGIGELGYLQAGDERTLEFDLSDSDKVDGSGTLELHVVRLKEEELQRGLAKLQNRQSELTSFSSNRIQLKTQDSEPGLVFVSTPANPGWEARLDGQASPIYVVYDAFLGIPVPAGEHELELRFIPPGFRTGALLSALALILAIGLAVLDLRGLRQAKSASPSPASPGSGKTRQTLLDPSIEAGWPQHFTPGTSKAQAVGSQSAAASSSQETGVASQEFATEDKEQAQPAQTEIENSAKKED
ncbi:MAG: YfhO family protein [Eubacteriales bacterium]|nr:YfhO family protein [Eubacteriales bacterium]